MTRKDFVAIADVIKNVPFTDKQDRVILSCRLVDMLSADNPRFDRTRFLEACGVTAFWPRT